jgi:hypothetical protein
VFLLLYKLLNYTYIGYVHEMSIMFFLFALVLFFGITFLLGWIAFRPKETDRGDNTLDMDLIREHQASEPAPETSRKLFFKALIRQAYRLTGKRKQNRGN